MIELDWKTLLMIVTVAVSFGHMMWSNYYLRHNIPELWKSVHSLEERYHCLDKNKRTREWEHKAVSVD